MSPNTGLSTQDHEVLLCSARPFVGCVGVSTASGQTQSRLRSVGDALSRPGLRRLTLLFACFKTAEIGNQMSVSVRNKTAASIEFSAGVVGTVVQA